MLSVRSLPGVDHPTLEDLPEPTPGPGEVLVEVRAATINPADPFVLSGVAGEAFGLPDSVGLGYDVAGTVAAVGPEVTQWSAGDRVVGLHDDLTAPTRGQADRAVLPASALAAIGDGIDDVAAATVPLNALTARQGLDLLGTPDGRTLLVTGAAGGVGGYAIALAAREGWKVLALARESDRDFVTGAGADLVTELPVGTVDAVLDAAALQEDALAAIVDGGDFVGVLPPVPVTSQRGIRVQAVLVVADGDALAGLMRLTATGVLPTRVTATYLLTEASAAYRRFAQGGRGRVVLTR